MHTSHIEGISEIERKNLLDELLEVATTSKNICRHKWQSGDLVLWDNRCLLHKGDKTLRWTSIVEYFTAQWLKGRSPFNHILHLLYADVITCTFLSANKSLFFSA